MGDDTTAALRTVFSDHDHDTATFEIESPEGDFMIQYTTSHGGGYLWNICDEPQRRPPERYEVVDFGMVGNLRSRLGFGEPSLTFVLAEGIDGTQEGARVELEELIDHIAGSDARVAGVETYRVGTGVVAEEVAYLYSRAKERVASVLGVTA